MRYLPSGEILRFRLALATKPHDVFFLCHVPTRNLDNTWNESNLQACEQAKTHVDAGDQPQGRGRRGLQDRRCPRPGRLSRTEVADAIARRADRQDLRRPHDRARRPPGLLRLIGAKQSMS